MVLNHTSVCESPLSIIRNLDTKATDINDGGVTRNGVTLECVSLLIMNLCGCRIHVNQTSVDLY